MNTTTPPRKAATPMEASMLNALQLWAVLTCPSQEVWAEMMTDVLRVYGGEEPENYFDDPRLNLLLLHLAGQVPEA